MGGTLCCSAKVNGQPLSTVATVFANAKHNKQLPLTRPRLGRPPLTSVSSASPIAPMRLHPLLIRLACPLQSPPSLNTNNAANKLCYSFLCPPATALGPPAALRYRAAASFTVPAPSCIIHTRSLISFPRGVHNAHNCIRSLIDSLSPKNSLASVRQANYKTRINSCLISHARPHLSTSAHALSPSYPATYLLKQVDRYDIAAASILFRNARYSRKRQVGREACTCSCPTHTRSCFCRDNKFPLFQHLYFRRILLHIPP